MTGANTGIGRATTEDLARRGGRVILACRSAEKTLPVIDAITAETGNDRLEHLPLDLADLDSVRTAAATLVERGEPIDVLIANAGVAGQRGETAQGFELAFGINHLGHFLFVTSLLDLLRAALAARVVIVASQAHYDAKDLDVDAAPGPDPDHHGPARSTTARSWPTSSFAQELARRVDPAEVAIYALHPGVVASDIWRRIPWPIRPLMTRAMISNEDGARTSLWCATSDDPELASGGYYDACAPKDPSERATPELAAWLWDRSEDWTAASRP